MLWYVGCSGPETSCLPAQSIESYGVICLFGPWRVTSPRFELKTLVFVVALLVPSGLPSVNWENGDDVRDAVTVTARVLLAENLRTSLTDEDTQKDKEKALPAENAEEKMQE